MKTNIKSLVLVLTGSIYGFVLFFSSICGAASYPTRTATPLATDLSMNQHSLTDLTDIVTKGPWADVRAYASFSAAIDAIGASNITLLIPNTQTVSANKTVPTNVHLLFLKGGSLSINAGVTVTINGSLDAPLAQIFQGAGSVVFGSGPVKEVYPEWWGATGDGIANDTAAIQKMLDVVKGSGKNAIVLKETYLSGNLDLGGLSNVVIKGGGEIKLTDIGSGTQAYIGLKLSGTIDNLTIKDIKITGDNVVTHWHAGIWVASSAILSNITMENVTVKDTVLGIAISSAFGSSVVNAKIINNTLINIIGEDSGQGYGIQCGTGGASNSKSKIIGNYIKGAQRHSIYMSNGGGVIINENIIADHRLGASTPSSQVPAIAISRSRDVICSHNIIDLPKDGAIGVSPAALGSGYVSENILISDNLIFNPSGNHSALIIGSVSPTLDEPLQYISIVNNKFYQSGNDIGQTLIYTGKHITYQGNQHVALNLTTVFWAFRLYGLGDGAGTATYSDDILVCGNSFSISATGAGVDSCGIVFDNSFATSIISAKLSENIYNVPRHEWSWATAPTNRNVWIRDKRSYNDADFDLNETLQTYIYNDMNGFINVTVPNDNAIAFYRLEAGTLTAISANALFSTILNNPGTYNLYFVENKLRVENKVANNKSVRVSFQE